MECINNMESNNNNTQEPESHFTAFDLSAVGGPCFQVYYEESSETVSDMIYDFITNKYGNYMDSFEMAGPYQDQYHTWKDSEVETALRLLDEESRVPINGKLPFNFYH